MARIKGGMNARKKHNRTLKLAKGYRGARSKQYRVAKQSVMRALTSAILLISFSLYHFKPDYLRPFISFCLVFPFNF